MNSESPSVIKKIAAVFAVVGTIAGTLTGIMTWANIGFICGFFTIWGKAFLTAFFIMIPLAAIKIILLTKLVNYYFNNLTTLQKNLIVGMIMAILMQSVMATVTTLNSVGYSNFSSFYNNWGHALYTAFPVGLAFALLMTTVVKPRLTAYVKS